MPRYKIHFIDNQHRFIRFVPVNALSKEAAFVKAEEIYKEKSWNFEYKDMIAELSLG